VAQQELLQGGEGLRKEEFEGEERERIGGREERERIGGREERERRRLRGGAERRRREGRERARGATTERESGASAR
jgi:hypothetical protein